ncbi:acetyltransferase, GNAT family [Gottschalkia acidurici 9a]|uniref:Acetyltransferase, GNAT family n=1 Tax=Gottschalkia acidurici (strain ATCC 7906 / DSM 604 / BCRC 14475 / CIP 104303 / KCTC 5404 / NCIMB 10678 / 9a) TaxID=1128398 RepID=K0AX86_GOTA9|nr:GNAT family N-acetyltransferase [Gottschalkia acidurici]AFS77829.1 acetyltransferase, GNAT family [Gottschalkia acidurici 9a]
MKEKYNFKLAREKDIDHILELIKKRIMWMDDYGIEQWNKTNYMEWYPKEYFSDCILQNSLYTLSEKEFDKIVGAVVLSDSDKLWEDKIPAYYIHNLVTDLDAKGAGSAIIKYCEDIAIEHGKDKLRLDCQSSNNKLNQYYENLGFIYIEEVQDGLYIGNKREKSL